MAFLMISDTDRFFSKFLYDKRETSFNNYELIIISKDIIADEKFQTDEGTTSYKSRYENVDFDMILGPTPKVYEFYNGSTIQNFVEAYKDQLTMDNRMVSLCCIVDLIVNDNKNVILLCSKSEYLMEYMQILRDFIQEQFRLNTFDIEDYENDNTCIDSDIENVEEVRTMLLFHMKNLGLIDDETGIIMNKLAGDLENKYRSILMNKEKDDLFNIAVTKGCYVNKRRPKEEIVDHILKKILKK